MAPLPLKSSRTTQYEQLNSILSNPYAEALEIDILPSTLLPETLYHPHPPSLGVPKPILVSAFIIAQEIFFSNNVTRAEKTETCKQILDATAVLLLWDPNHITSVNFRRRQILHFINGVNDNETLIEAAIRRELVFLESFQTSPLPKHTKSSTLWSYRLWLVTKSLQVLSDPRTGPDRHSWWNTELRVVMKAGDRHPRNYYAWNYARDLLRVLYADKVNEMEKTLSGESVIGIHRWCLQHPRDISGWTFLISLLQNLVTGKRFSRDDEESVRKIHCETSAFVRKYEWQGKSIELFLNTIDSLEKSYK